MSNTTPECTTSDQDGDEVRITKIESPTVMSMLQKTPIQLHLHPSVCSSSTPAVTLVQGPAVRRTVITDGGGPLFSRTPTCSSQVQHVLSGAALPSPTLPTPLIAPSAVHPQRTSGSSSQNRTVIISRMGDPNHQHIPQFLPTPHPNIDPALQVHPKVQTVSIPSLSLPRNSVPGVSSQILQAKPGSSLTYRVVQTEGGETVAVVPKPAHQSVQQTCTAPIAHATVQPRQLPTPTSPNVALDPYRVLHPVLPQPKVHPPSQQQQQPGGYVAPASGQQPGGYVAPASGQQPGGYVAPASGQQPGGYVAPASGQRRKRPVPAVLFEPQYTKRARFYTVVTQGIPPQPPQVCQTPPVPTTRASPSSVEGPHRTVVQLPKVVPLQPVAQPTSVQRTSAPLAQGQFGGMPATMAARQGM